MNKNIDIDGFKIKNRIVNFVWCSGRSGSTALYKSLPNCFHTHTFLYFLNQKGIDWNCIKNHYDFNLFDILQENLREHKSDNIYIYDVYRTPIERKISAFFQYLDTVVKNNNIDLLLTEARKYREFYSYDINKVTVLNFVDYFTINIQHLTELFVYFFFLKSDNYYSFLEFGDYIDPSFNCNEFYHIKSDQFIFTILKYSQIMNWSNHIYQTSSQLINVNHINSSRSTSFGFLYNQFMNILFIPKVLYDIVMNCDIQMHPLIPICNHYQVMKKFMNKKEIELYKNYWANRLVLTSNDHYLQKFASDLLN